MASVKFFPIKQIFHPSADIYMKNNFPALHERDLVETQE